jgi:hypothetical protein
LTTDITFTTLGVRELNKEELDLMAQYSHTNSKGVTYYLFTSVTKLRGGKEQRIYYFSKSDTNAKGEATDLPDDRKVEENPRNGFLVLKKK